MKRVTRSSFFALYGSFCGLGIGMLIAMVLTLLEHIVFGEADGLILWRRLSFIFCIFGFLLGLYYSLKPRSA